MIDMPENGGKANRLDKPVPYRWHFPERLVFAKPHCYNELKGLKPNMVFMPNILYALL